MQNQLEKKNTRTGTKKFQQLIRRHHQVRYNRAKLCSKIEHMQDKSHTRNFEKSLILHQSPSLDQHACENLCVQPLIKEGKSKQSPKKGKLKQSPKIIVDKQSKLKKKLSTIVENFENYDDMKLKKMGKKKFQQLIKQHRNICYIQGKLLNSTSRIQVGTSPSKSKLSSITDESYSPNVLVPNNLCVLPTEKRKLSQPSAAIVDKRVKLKSSISIKNFDDGKSKKVGDKNIRKLVKQKDNTRYNPVKRQQETLNIKKN